MESVNREYDVVIYGATGFSGKLCCDYLQSHAADFLGLFPATTPNSVIKWAVAGRSQSKLEQLVSSLQKRSSQHHCPPSSSVLVADCQSEAVLADKVTSKCAVLLNCAGPFLQTGEAVVQACLRTNTHYTDITGEPQFFNALVKKYHEAALRSNVWIVPACGFDCFPSEVGFFETIQQCHATAKKEEKQDQQGGESAADVVVDCFVTVQDQGFSTGTLRTLINSIAAQGASSSNKQAPQKEQQDKSSSTAAAGRAASIVGFKKLPQRPHYSKLVRKWVLPLPSADPSVIRRQFQILQEYGSNYPPPPHIRGYRHWATTSSSFVFFKSVLVMLILTLLIKYVPFGRRAVTALVELINGKNGGPTQLAAGKCLLHFFVSKTNKTTAEGGSKDLSTATSTVTTDHIYTVTAAAATCATLAALLVHRESVSPSSSNSRSSSSLDGGVVSMVSFLARKNNNNNGGGAGVYDAVKLYMEQKGGVVCRCGSSVSNAGSESNKSKL